MRLKHRITIRRKKKESDVRMDRDSLVVCIRNGKPRVVTSPPCVGYTPLRLCLSRSLPLSGPRGGPVPSGRNSEGETGVPTPERPKYLKSETDPVEQTSERTPNVLPKSSVHTLVYARKVTDYFSLSQSLLILFSKLQFVQI